MDARGSNRLTVTTPSDREIVMTRVFEIVRPERIVWTFEWEGAPGNSGPETMTFEERDGATLVTTRSVLGSAEERDALLGSGMVSGAEETYERLDEYLAVLRESPVG